MPKRSGKFYRKNEAEVMKLLGFEPTPNSGSGWVVKEDGQNDNCICQLKSTDAKSIKVNLQDIHTLEYNACVEHKIPVFAIQFLETNEIFLIVKPEDAGDISRYINTGGHIKHNLIELDQPGGLLEAPVNKPRIIRSSESSRLAIKEEINEKYKKRKKEAK